MFVLFLLRKIRWLLKWLLRSMEHQLQQIADNGQQAAVLFCFVLFWTWRGKCRLQRCYLWGVFSLHCATKEGLQSSTDIRKLTALFFHSVRDWDEHVAGLPGRFCFCSKSASYHSSHLEPFCMATPREGSLWGLSEEGSWTGGAFPSSDGRMPAE